MKNRIVTILILVLCLTNVAVVIFLFSGMRPHHGGPNFPPRMGGDSQMDMMDEELGLSEEQAAQMKKMRTAHMAAIDKHFEEMDELRTQFINEALNPDLDKEKVEKFARMIGDKKAEFELTQIEHFQQLAKILKPDQLAKLKEIMAEKPDHNHGPDHGPNRGPDRGFKDGPPGPPRMEF